MYNSLYLNNKHDRLVVVDHHSRNIVWRAYYSVLSETKIYFRYVMDGANKHKDYERKECKDRYHPKHHCQRSYQSPDRTDNRDHSNISQLKQYDVRDVEISYNIILKAPKNRQTIEHVINVNIHDCRDDCRRYNDLIA